MGSVFGFGGHGGGGFARRLILLLMCLLPTAPAARTTSVIVWRRRSSTQPVINVMKLLIDGAVKAASEPLQKYGETVYDTRDPAWIAPGWLCVVTNSSQKRSRWIPPDSLRLRFEPEV